MADKIFLDGLRFWKKRDNAPDFVQGSLVLTLDDLNAWAKANPQYLSDYQGKQQIRLQITKGKEGGLVFAVDTWKPDGAAKVTNTLPGTDLPF